MTVPTQSFRTRLPGVHEIDPDASRISLATRHVFSLGRVRGSFDVTGERVTVDERTGAAGARAHVDVTVHTGSVDTGKMRREDAVRSPAFLDLEAHPNIALRSAGDVREGASWVVRGKVTARGATAPVDLRVVELREKPGGACTCARRPPSTATPRA